MKTLLLFLDAFRHSYLTKENTPFIRSLAEGGVSANLNTLPGYHVEYSIMSGYYPSKHNVWTWFYLDPENSLFRWTKTWRPLLELLDRTPARSAMRKFVTYYTSVRRYMGGRTRMLPINQLPLDQAPLYNLSVDKNFCDRNPINVPTIFDILRRRKIRYIGSEWPIVGTNDKVRVLTGGGSDGAKIKLMLDAMDGDYEFFFTHVWELDSKMHRYGVDHAKVREHLRYLDGKVKELVTKLRKDGPANVVIFSDHGMVPIERTVNVMEEFRRMGISEDDYTMLPDSTMVRVWVRKKGMEEKMKRSLKKTGFGKVYDRKNVSKLHIRYDRKNVGDFLFMVRPGLQISPNFFQGNGVAKAMHGYAEHVPGLDGIFIANGPGIRPRKIRNARLVDVCPTTLKAMGVKAPGDFDGRVVGGI